MLIEYQKKLVVEVKIRTAEIEKKYRELEQLNIFIEKLSRSTIKTMENERQALSKEIHDSIGGSLAAIKMLLENRLLFKDGSPPEGSMSLEKIVDHLAELINESRRISCRMRPLALENVTIGMAISDAIETFNEFYPKIKTELQGGISDGGTHEEIKTVLYRVIQEALNNIGKHSGADYAKVELNESKDSIFLKVTDNGCGFDVSRTIHTARSLQGFGTLSMRERVEMFKGTFDVHSEPGNGTVVSVSIPKYVHVKRPHWHKHWNRNRLNGFKKD